MARGCEKRIAGIPTDVRSVGGMCFELASHGRAILSWMSRGKVIIARQD